MILRKEFDIIIYGTDISIYKDRQYTDITYWYTYTSRKTRFLKVKQH